MKKDGIVFQRRSVQPRGQRNRSIYALRLMRHANGRHVYIDKHGLFAVCQRHIHPWGRLGNRFSVLLKPVQHAAQQVAGGGKSVGVVFALVATSRSGKTTAISSPGA